MVQQSLEEGTDLEAQASCRQPLGGKCALQMGDVGKHRARLETNPYTCLPLVTA